MHLSVFTKQSLKILVVGLIWSVLMLATIWLVVNQLSERGIAIAAPGDACVVTSIANAGTGTLRDCLLNASAGDTITFDPSVFPPESPVSINLTTSLPELAQGNMTIDANNAGVILDGSALSTGEGILLTSDQNIIKGLEIINFPNNGILICCGGSFNVIGGTQPGEGNVIGGNAFSGISLRNVGTNNNTGIGNFVGTDATGTVANPNGEFGIVTGDGAKFNTIGGTAPGEANVISRNNWGVGIVNPGTDDNVIQGNYIGTDASGTANLGNTFEGINIFDGAKNNTIADNLISGNNNSGIFIESTGTIDNIVIGNYIGTDANGTPSLGNSSGGIIVCCGASENAIGGGMVGDGNLIAGNGGDGVRISGGDVLRNTISQNSIHSNASQGIELESGGNLELPAPVILVGDTGAGTAAGIACALCAIEVFSDSENEGRVFEGSTTADASGDWSFTKGSPLTGPFTTATVTDPQGNTSEFSQPYAPVIVLENENLHIELLQTHPKVEQYVLKSTGGVIYGDLVNETFVAYIFYQDAFHYVEPALDTITRNSDSVCYHIRNELNSQLAVTLDLCYVLLEFSVEVVFSNVQETPGYKLIYVSSPDLLTVQASQTGAQLVFPYADGRLIDISATTPDYQEVDLSQTGWTQPLLAGMIYHDGLVGILSYDHLDMAMYERVVDHTVEGRLGMIGMVFNYRYAPTDFTSTTFIEVFDANTTSLTANLTFVADYDNDLDIDWIDGAKYLRDQVQATPDPRYVSSFITKIGRNGVGHSSEHLETFEKSYHLTDHNKIIGYLLDYNTDIFEIFGVDEDIDPDFATLDELIDLFQTAEDSFNVFLSFHDIYSDYYPGTPGYDPSLRVILEDGTPALGWPLPAFPVAYRTDPFDYAEAEGIARVQNTMARYPIKESHHIDVFNVLFEKDYSFGSPASRERNRQGLQLIIDEFDSFGVDVTSETLTGPYVESGIGWFVDTPRTISTTLSFDAEFIPMLEFIYHGKTLYGLFEDIYYDVLPPDQVEIYTFLEPLLLGANSAAHITYLDPNDLELDKFYLIDLPWMALNERFMEDYEVVGSYRKITYDTETFVEIDYESDTYTVQVDGRVIGQDYATFFPKDNNAFLIYSRDAKTLSEPLPDEWGNNLILVKLKEDGTKERVVFQLINGVITFNVEADTPYKLIYLDTPIFLPVILSE